MAFRVTRPFMARAIPVVSVSVSVPMPMSVSMSVFVSVLSGPMSPVAVPVAAMLLLVASAPPILSQSGQLRLSRVGGVKPDPCVRPVNFAEKLLQLPVMFEPADTTGVGLRNRCGLGDRDCRHRWVGRCSVWVLQHLFLLRP
jgi:hypothetical protein